MKIAHLISRTTFRLPEDRQQLPLAKGVLVGARDAYSAFIAVMRPMDFLRLTVVKPADIDDIMQDEFAPSVDAFASGADTRFTRGSYGMPFLTVSYPDGRVTGHEGRHRAAMVMRSGGKSFPVALRFQTPVSTVVTWEEGSFDANHEVEFEDMIQSFANPEDGRAFKDELEAVNRDMSSDRMVSRIRMDWRGGARVKGRPVVGDDGRTRFVAWTPSDMPHTLIGEFNTAIRVPVSSMKIGLVKGYTHFR